MEAPVLVAPETAHRSTWPMLARHFLEMVAAMWVAMALGGLIFVPILGALGMTARLRRGEEANNR